MEFALAEYAMDTSYFSVPWLLVALELLTNQPGTSSEPSTEPGSLGPTGPVRP